MVIKTTDLCDHFAEQLEIARPIGFRNFGGKKSFFGQIVTVKCFENNPLVRQTLEQNGEGKVLVIDGGGSLRRALIGDMLASVAVNNNWSGVVVYGCVRDAEAIADLQIGIKALDTHPLKSFKNETGECNVAVHFAGVVFKPDEYIYSDQDGIVLCERPIHLELPSK